MKIVVLCLGVLLVAAPAEAFAAGGDDACDLLRRSEIVDAVGDDAGKPERLGIGDSSCFWELSGADGGGLVLTLFRGRDAQSEFGAARSAYREDALAEVADLGREAFATPTGDVWVLKGRRTAFFVTGTFDAAASENLARLALERL
jgi:hypothetical protein